MKNKKGQAALEFLTTYGWAFLVILVMIAALAYFGVLNPQRFLPDRCVMGAEIGCTDYQISGNGDATGDLNLYLTNNIGETMEEMNVTSSDPNVGDCETVPGGADSATNVAGGSAAQFTCPLSADVPGDGEKLKLPIQISYKTLTGKFTRVVNGEVFATVQ